jgi:hypothetical protein
MLGVPPDVAFRQIRIEPAAAQQKSQRHPSGELAW